MKEFFNQKGYTLIELLAVVLILTTVGGIVTAIVATSLQGGNRSTTVNEVRQDGNFAVTQMAKMIRYAQSFEGASITGVSDSYDTNCIPETPPQGQPTPTPKHYKYLKFTNFDGGQTEFICKDRITDNPKTISSNSANLISSDRINLVQDSCYFICRQDNSALPPAIDIFFTLSASGSGSLVENKSTVPFSTSVNFRNTGD
jgi:prepilin-type N-terminal cleavage/methylation domain-containing protein